jgi:hypothetical protein
MLFRTQPTFPSPLAAHCPEPHLTQPVENLLEALTWVSIGILCIFIVGWLPA